jgi:hypothetical protein
MPLSVIKFRLRSGYVTTNIVCLSNNLTLNIFDVKLKMFSE